MLNEIHHGARRCNQFEIEREKLAAHLHRAFDLLAEPGTWMQEDYAKDLTGKTVDSCSQTAGRFCSSGAVYATARQGDCTVSTRALLACAIGGDIEVWNDAPGRTLDEVLQAFQRAIALALENEASSIDKSNGTST